MSRTLRGEFTCPAFSTRVFIARLFFRTCASLLASFENACTVETGKVDVPALPALSSVFPRGCRDIGFQGAEPAHGGCKSHGVGTWLHYKPRRPSSSTRSPQTNSLRRQGAVEHGHPLKTGRRRTQTHPNHKPRTLSNPMPAQTATPTHDRRTGTAACVDTGNQLVGKISSIEKHPPRRSQRSSSRPRASSRRTTTPTTSSRQARLHRAYLQRRSRLPRRRSSHTNGTRTRTKRSSLRSRISAPPSRPLTLIPTPTTPPSAPCPPPLTISLASDSNSRKAAD